MTIKRNHRVRLRSFSSSSSSSLLRSLCLARFLALCSSIRRTEITLIDVINDIIRRATDKRAPAVPAVVYTPSRSSRQNKTRGKRNTLLRGLLSCRSTGCACDVYLFTFFLSTTLHDARCSAKPSVSRLVRASNASLINVGADCHERASVHVTALSRAPCAGTMFVYRKCRNT